MAIVEEPMEAAETGRPLEPDANRIKTCNVGEKPLVDGSQMGAAISNSSTAGSPFK
jgi:hypothetical protein